MKKLETDTFRVFLRGFVFVVFVSYVMFVSSNIKNMILDTYRSKKENTTLLPLLSLVSRVYGQSSLQAVMLVVLVFSFFLYLVGDLVSCKITPNLLYRNLQKYAALCGLKYKHWEVTLKGVLNYSSVQSAQSPHFNSLVYCAGIASENRFIFLHRCMCCICHLHFFSEVIAHWVQTSHKTFSYSDWEATVRGKKKT